MEAVILVGIAFQDADADLEEAPAGAGRLEAILAIFFHRAGGGVVVVRDKTIGVVGKVFHAGRGFDEPVAAVILALVGDVGDHAGMVETGGAVEAEWLGRIDLGRHQTVADGLGRETVQRGGGRGVGRIGRNEGCVTLGERQGGRGQ